MMCVALAIGDPNGTGPEIAVKAATAGLCETRSKLRLVLFGDAGVIRWYARRCAPGLAVRCVSMERLPARKPDVIDMVDVGALPAAVFSPGKIHPDAGVATLAYVKAGLDAARMGYADAVIACPHSETAINASGVRFSGYPGFVAQHMGLHPDDVYLLLAGGGLRIVHATLHEGIVAALTRLEPRHVVNAARAAVAALRNMGIADPVVGLMGINPHAGEGGLFGHEDIRVTGPAARRLRDEGIVVIGPQGADLLLTRGDVDLFVAMYHD